MLNALMESLSALVFPPVCEACDAVILANPPLGVCQKCRAQIKPIAGPHCPGCGRTLIEKNTRCADCEGESYAFDRAVACAIYEGTLRKLLHAYKFENRKYLKYFFVDLAVQFIKTYLHTSDFDLTLAVPMEKNRRIERGFNQSELISLEIAKQFSIPHSSGNLIHVGPGIAQSLLAKHERKENVKNAFLIRNADEFRSRHVLLIDDILTTGYTASECARVLKKADTSSVTVLALARGA